MNDGAKILEIQNSKPVIEMLGAQREFYRRAKSWQNASIMSGIAIPYLMTAFEIFFPDKIPLPLFVTIEVVLFVITLVSERKKSELVENGASVQQGIDSVVYGIPFDHIYSDDATILEMYRADATRAYENRPLTNWYSVEIQGLSANEAIPRCQRTNVGWTNKLATILMIIIVGTTLVGTAVLFRMTYERGKIFISLYFVFSFIECALQTCLSQIDNTKAMSSLESACKDYVLGDETNIRRVQDKILDYRRRPAILVPEWLYSLTRKSQEKHADAIAAARKHGGQR